MRETTPAVRKFVAHWGEMGARWGVNRTVAQIHALLYLSHKPLDAEEIGEALSIARSNVSTSLRELQSWGLVRVVHVPGQRRDSFESMQDVWEMLRRVLEERKRREIDPTIRVLVECAEEAAHAKDRETQQRLEAMLGVFRTMDAWYRDVGGMPLDRLQRLVKMGSRLGKLLRLGR